MNCRKTLVRTLLALVVGFSLTSVRAESVYSVNDRILTIRVPAGETNEVDAVKFSSAMSAGVTNITKTAVGCLVMNADLSDYEGDIHIESGTWRFVDDKGLGKRAVDPDTSNAWVAENGVGQVHVAKGATLECAAPTSVFPAGKIIRFGGTGVNGVGALLFNSPAQQDRAFGTNLIMTDDALVSSLSEKHSCGFRASDVRLEMNKKTLTVRMSSATPAFYFQEVRIKDETAGDLVFEGNARVVMRNYNKLSSGTLTVRDGASVNLDVMGGGLVRKLVWDSTATNDWSNPRMEPMWSSRVCAWQKPVTLQKTMTTAGIVQFNDAVSGSGGLAFIGGTAPTNAVDFLSTNLTFKGCFEAKDVNVTFPSSAHVYSFATACVSVTTANRISNGVGNWQCLVKEGSGLLDYASRLGADMLDVRGGTIMLNRLESETLADVAGMVEGVGWYSGTKTLVADINAGYTYRERIRLGIDEIYTSVTGIKKMPQWLLDAGETDVGKRYLLTYSGYIWNHSDQPVTWTFAGSILSHSAVQIDGKPVYYSDNANGGLVCGTVTLSPGPHAFWCCCSHAKNDGGAPSAVPEFYMQYDPQGRGTTDRDNYIKIENKPNELPLLTWKLPGAAVTYPREEHIYEHQTYGVPSPAWTHDSHAVFGNMSFAPGTGIDLAATTNTLATLKGIPAVTHGGRLVVTDSWTVSTDDLKAGQTMHVQSLGFGTDTEFVIQDLGRVRGSEWVLATSEEDITGTIRIKDADVLSLGNWRLIVESRQIRLWHRTPGMIFVIR